MLIQQPIVCSNLSKAKDVVFGGCILRVKTILKSKKRIKENDKDE